MNDARSGGLHPSRRRFLKDAAGLAALSATVGAVPLASAAAEPRRKPQERKRVLFLTHPGVGTGHASLPALPPALTTFAPVKHGAELRAAPATSKR